MLEKELVRVGLTKNEAKVYLCLLKSKGLKIKDLVKETKLSRGVVYFLLDELIKKRLVSKKAVSQKQSVYFASSPVFLKNLITDQLKEAQAKDSSLAKLLPHLLETFQQQIHQPVIQFFDGREGVKKVYQDTLKEKKEILAILQRGEIDPKIVRWLRKVYIHKRIKQKIPAKVILAQDEKAKEYVKESKERLREVITVPKKVFPIKMEVDIYGNKVGFISLHKDAPHFGVIIDSSYVADTLRALWNLAWIGAGKEKVKTYLRRAAKTSSS